QCSTVRLMVNRRSASSDSAELRATSTATHCTWPPRPLSTTPSPHRVSPGSIPNTRTPHLLPAVTGALLSLAPSTTGSLFPRDAGIGPFRRERSFESYRTGGVHRRRHAEA